MTKSVSLLILILFLISSDSFGQFSFKDDSTDSRIQSGAMEEIDKKFHLQKDNDFELRLFIFPKSQDHKSGLWIFILFHRGGQWNVRLFQNAWSKQTSKEITLKASELDSLWEKLTENDILTIPRAQDLVDRKGEIIVEQLQADNNSILYSFELLSNTAVRHYAYKCPLGFSKKYDYIPTFKKVSNIVQLILQFCQIENKMSC